MNEKTAHSIRAAIAVMAGRREAMGAFDLSADGFWGSFAAIVAALPALAVGWYAAALRAAAEPGGYALDRLIAAYAVTDLLAWIAPLALFALLARPAGLADRFPAYVVASNWASVPVIWLMLPGAFLDALLPPENPLSVLVSFGLFGLALALTWRLTETAIGRWPMIGTAVFVAMFLAGMATLAGMQALLGV